MDNKNWGRQWKQILEKKNQILKKSLLIDKQIEMQIKLLNHHKEQQLLMNKQISELTAINNSLDRKIRNNRKDIEIASKQIQKLSSSVETKQVSNKKNMDIFKEKVKMYNELTGVHWDLLKCDPVQMTTGRGYIKNPSNGYIKYFNLKGKDEKLTETLYEEMAKAASKNWDHFIEEIKFN